MQYAQYNTRVDVSFKNNTWRSQEGYFYSMINGVNNFHVECELYLDGDHQDSESLVDELNSLEGTDHLDVSFSNVIKDLKLVAESFDKTRLERSAVRNVLKCYLSQTSNHFQKTILTPDSFIKVYDDLVEEVVEVKKGDAVYVEGLSDLKRGANKFWDNVFFMREDGSLSSSEEIFDNRISDSTPIEYNKGDLSTSNVFDTFKPQLLPSFKTSFGVGINRNVLEPVELNFSNLSDDQLRSMICWSESFVANKSKKIIIDERPDIERYFLDSFSISFKDFNTSDFSLKLAPDYRSVCP